MIKYIEKDFDQELPKSRVLVDFYADWCGPCRMLGPLLEDISEIDIYKVNIDKFANIAERYGIMSIPTLMIMDDGKIIKNHVGLLSKDELNNFIK